MITIQPERHTGGVVMVKGTNLFLIGLVFVGIVSLLPIAGANYAFDGVPYPDKLELVAHGTLTGGVYVGESRGLGFPPYEQQFELPRDATVKWARLYVGVWGGTERYEGWLHMSFNGHDLGKTVLRGINDENSHVYCSSHGSYWVHYDVTGTVIPGLNSGIADTSRGERGSNLDGRVYGIILVAIYEAENGAETSYWVSEGNPSLHGKGWAGTVPSINDFASVQFNGTINPANANAAQLTVTYLAGNPGEPDYLEFNGQGIGGNDVANNKDGETYGIDLTTFDVTEHVRATNGLLFLRGKDINGDGMIDVDDDGNLEGEYYFHPVLAVLAVQHKTIEKATPDFTVELEFTNSTEGANTCTAVVNNYGRLYENDVRLTVLVDKSEIYSDVVRMDASGMKKVAIPWNATYGTHTVAAAVDAGNMVQESNENNNVFSADVYAVHNFDLSVTILTPVPEDRRTKMAIAGPPSTGVVTFASTIASGGLTGILVLLGVRSKSAKKKKLSVALSICFVLSMALLISGCVDEQSTNEMNPGGMLWYSVPLEIRNEGDSPATNFELSLYVDDEKNVIKTIDRLDGGGSVTEELPIVVTEGTHRIRAVVDEKNKLKESRRDNNVDEITFEF